MNYLHEFNLINLLFSWLVYCV